MSKYILENVDYGRNLNDKVKGCKNFYYWEFVSSITAIRNNIKNIPTEKEWQNIEYLCQTVLQPLRDKLKKSLTINSGFRCKELNDLAGSSDTSFHRLGCAADVDSDDIPLMEILETAIELPHTEIIAEYFPNGWVHIAISKDRKDKTLKLKDSKHHFSKVDIEYIKNIYKK